MDGHLRGFGGSSPPPDSFSYAPSDPLSASHPPRGASRTPAARVGNPPSLSEDAPDGRRLVCSRHREWWRGTPSLWASRDGCANFCAQVCRPMAPAHSQEVLSAAGDSFLSRAAAAYTESRDSALRRSDDGQPFFSSHGRSGDPRDFGTRRGLHDATGERDLVRISSLPSSMPSMRLPPGCRRGQSGAATGCLPRTPGAEGHETRKGHPLSASRGHSAGLAHHHGSMFLWGPSHTTAEPCGDTSAAVEDSRSAEPLSATRLSQPRVWYAASQRSEVSSPSSPRLSCPRFPSASWKTDETCRAAPPGPTHVSSASNDPSLCASLRASVSSFLELVWLCVSIFRASLAVYVHGVLDCLSVHRFLLYCFRSPVICQKSVSCLLLNGGLFLGLIQFFTHILMPVIAALCSFVICFLASLFSLLSSYNAAPAETGAASSPGSPLLGSAVPLLGSHPAPSPRFPSGSLSPVGFAFFSFASSLGSPLDGGAPFSAGSSLDAAASVVGFPPSASTFPEAAGRPGAATVAWLVPLVECTLWSLFRYLILYPLYCCNSLFNSLWYRDIADTAAALLLQDEARLRKARKKRSAEKAAFLSRPPCGARVVADAALAAATLDAMHGEEPGGASARGEKRGLDSAEKSEGAGHGPALSRVYRDKTSSCSSLAVSSPPISCGRTVSLSPESSRREQELPVATCRVFSSGLLQEAPKGNCGASPAPAASSGLYGPQEGETLPRRAVGFLRSLWTWDAGVKQKKGTAEEAPEAAGKGHPEYALIHRAPDSFSEGPSGGAPGRQELRNGGEEELEPRRGVLAASRFDDGAGDPSPSSFSSREKPEVTQVEARAERHDDIFSRVSAFMSLPCIWLSPAASMTSPRLPPVSPSSFYSSSFFSPSAPAPPTVGGPAAGGTSPCEFILRLLLHYVWWIAASVFLPLIPFIGPPLSLINLSWLFAFYCFDWHDYLPYTSFAPCPVSSPSANASPRASSSAACRARRGGAESFLLIQNQTEEAPRWRGGGLFSGSEDTECLQSGAYGTALRRRRGASSDARHDLARLRCASIPASRDERDAAAACNGGKRLIGAPVDASDSIHLSSCFSFSPFAQRLPSTRASSRPCSAAQGLWRATETRGEDSGPRQVLPARLLGSSLDAGVASFPGCDSERSEGEEVFARRVSAWIARQRKSVEPRKHGAKRSLSPAMKMRIQRLVTLVSSNRGETERRAKTTGDQLHAAVSYASRSRRVSHSRAISWGGAFAQDCLFVDSASADRSSHLRRNVRGSVASDSLPALPFCARTAASDASLPATDSGGERSPRSLRSGGGGLKLSRGPRWTRGEDEGRRGAWKEDAACHPETRILFVGEMRSRLKYFEEHWLYFAGFGLPVCLVQLVCSSFVDYGVLSMLFPVCIVTSLHALPIRWVSREDESLLRPYRLFHRLPIFAPIQLLTRHILRVLARYFATTEEEGGAGKLAPQVPSAAAEVGVLSAGRLFI
ncbi:hypothetical protein BESB_054680 [Besnoitia besnoiti]|uniref:Transporter, small conductance mechanosensitive ion channel (MscS) family protein n=1 Tax=Besnoitia besnoiti TaxID=94643 RepID=A0A2A9MJP4_BESBE|nr:hypothetical protein BESB_054680 [Besnoitia besnoiti]PFH35817.1 hypothetical protein BESB_054680 [Besnoitia besnoiti]